MLTLRERHSLDEPFGGNSDHRMTDIESYCKPSITLNLQRSQRHQLTYVKAPENGLLPEHTSLQEGHRRMFHRRN